MKLKNNKIIINLIFYNIYIYLRIKLNINRIYIHKYIIFCRKLDFYVKNNIFFNTLHLRYHCKYKHYLGLRQDLYLCNQ